MNSAARLAALLCLLSALCPGETWSGTLVDSRCFDALERNVNPTDTMTYVDRDVNSELRYCSPGRKTKLFAVIEPDGTNLRLDSDSNLKAGSLVRSLTRQSRIFVTVTGEMTGKTVHVASITPVK